MLLRKRAAVTVPCSRANGILAFGGVLLLLGTDEPTPEQRLPHRSDTKKTVFWRLKGSRQDRIRNNFAYATQCGLIADP